MDGATAPSLLPADCGERLPGATPLPGAADEAGARLSPLTPSLRRDGVAGEMATDECISPLPRRDRGVTDDGKKRGSLEGAPA